LLPPADHRIEYAEEQIADMDLWRSTLGLGSCCCLSFALLGTGCASKKYVNKQVGPLDQRITSVEKKTNEHGSSIEGIETDLSKTREQVLDLDANLGKTNQRLDETSNRADQAATTAQNAETRAIRLERAIDNMDAYKLARTTQVLFAVSKSNLDAAAKAELDAIAQEAMSKKRFVFEVQGFTDSRGSASLNLALSQRRAEAVVRYLTMEKQIPLRNIHLIGAGPASPVADNRTREGRRQNRRVELRLFALELDLSSSAVTPAQLR
jgi:outer membrane protein OmpA-like peptidoglycan-associated protein